MRRFFLCSQNNDSKNYGFYQSVFFDFIARPHFAKTKRGANGKFLPKPLLFHLRHNSKSNERTRQIRATTRSARAISRHHQGCFQNTFELCTMNTAIFRKGFLTQKYSRHEVPSVLNSPRRILNPKGFSTLRVAPR